MAAAPKPPISELPPRRISLDKLLLDVENPRFGDLEGKTASQAEVLDHIVEKFGVDDVLSSLAVNGYFDAEPLVCRQQTGDDKFVVVEGNRRLAACLIITGDSRASHQAKRTHDYGAMWLKHGKKTIDPVPVIVFGKSQESELLSYLGVRHIASAQPWDSYAKASWVARIVEESKLPLQDVALMIGDQHKTISRLLEGYYFIQQVIETGNFKPEDSVRKGRGSVSEYPFSWVYTFLGYSTPRKFLELPEGAPVRNPLPERSLQKAGLITRAMFGDRSKGRNAAIDDSREIGDLAATLSSPEKISMLEQGKTVQEITRATKPIDERLRQGLAQVREIQSDLLAGLTENVVSIEIAGGLVDISHRNRRSATEIEKKLRSIVTPDGDDD